MAEYPPPLPANPAAPKIVHPARGWFLIVIGFGLSGSMLYVGIAIYRTIQLGDRYGSHARWTGTPEFTRTTFEIFGAVFLFGLLAIAAGVHIVRTRRINKVLAIVMILLVALIVALGAMLTNAHPVPP